MLPGGSSDTTGAPAGTHSPCTKSVSCTSPSRGDALRLLREPPVGLRERGARGGDLGLGGADLVGARGEPRGRELRAQLLDLSRGRARPGCARRRGARPRRSWRGSSSSLALEVRFGELEVRLRLDELRRAPPRSRLGRFAFCRFASCACARATRSSASRRCAASFSCSSAKSGVAGCRPGRRASPRAWRAARRTARRRARTRPRRSPGGAAAADRCSRRRRRRGALRLRAAPSGVRRAASTALAVPLHELLQGEPGRIEAALHRAGRAPGGRTAPRGRGSASRGSGASAPRRAPRRRSAARRRRFRGSARATAARAAGGR